MAESAVAKHRSLLELSPAQRREQGVDDEAVVDALMEIVEHGTEDEKILTDCTFPALDLDFLTLNGDNNYPLVFRNCTFEGAISAVDADTAIPIRFEGCDIAGFELEGARFEFDFAVSDSTIAGAVDAFETRFDDRFEVTGTTFASPVSFEESHFGNDATFDDATFEAAVSFKTAAFSGTSNELDDNASFEGATFEDEVDLHQATFRYADFTEATFGGRAGFQEVTFDGDSEVPATTFAGEADFDEADFGEDVTFAKATFEGPAVFRGAEFEGGTRSLEADATFCEAVFEDELNFRDAHLRDGLFEDLTVVGRAMFQQVRFDGDASFDRTTFQSEADFDEARFYGDASFCDVAFEANAVFRGAEFRGGDNHLQEDASFDDARFGELADFTDSVFSSGSFRKTQFAATADFSGSTFERGVFYVVPVANESYVDFTGGILKDGEIHQPEGGWVRYDLTSASLGSVSLSAANESDHRQLLDYFRFCTTEFNEFDGYDFDFSAHTDYLDRNDWALHEFDENFADTDYAQAMTPEAIERTYLKAKTAASNAGQMKAAGEFRVKRQQYARKKYMSIALDGTNDVGTRLTNASRAIENAFLGVTCGHGMRLGRIVAVFVLFPLVPAVLYTFGGSAFATGVDPVSTASSPFSPEGLRIIYENVHFSYITFLTIGYGNIGPQGVFARMLAGIEVYVSVILSGLVLYGLIKRSEI
jgi:uncharacterized protein YjbI with pentapeptide repeats